MWKRNKTSVCMTLFLECSVATVINRKRLKKEDGFLFVLKTYLLVNYIINLHKSGPMNEQQN